MTPTLEAIDSTVYENLENLDGAALRPVDVYLNALVGNDVNQGTEWFQFHVRTPHRSEMVTEFELPMFAEKALLVQQWDFDVVVTSIKEALLASAADSWEGVVANMRRYVSRSEYDPPADRPMDIIRKLR